MIESLEFLKDVLITEYRCNLQVVRIYLLLFDFAFMGMQMPIKCIYYKCVYLNSHVVHFPVRTSQCFDAVCWLIEGYPVCRNFCFKTPVDGI